MKTKETSTRQKALIWWDNLPFNSRNDKSKASYCFNFKGHFNYKVLTVKEIEEIWLKEINWENESHHNEEDLTNSQIESLYKSNQKQCNKPFRRGIVELSGKKCIVNYRFIDEDTIEMYADDLSYIGETHYKSLIEDCIISKSNAKQFKQFSPELFDSYCMKFSEKDRLQLAEIAVNNCKMSFEDSAKIIEIIRKYR